MSTTAIVVGAGVIGAGVALELARAGLSVTVVDRGGAPGQGSTSASSAIVRYHYRHWDEAVLAWESGQRWSRWTEYLEISDPIGMAKFVNTGLLVLPGETLDMADALVHMEALGIEVESLGTSEIQRRFPALDADLLGPPSLPDDPHFWAESRGAGIGFWIPQCGFIDDPQLAAHNLAFAGESIGVSYRFNSKVTDIVRSDGRVGGVQLATGEVIDAPIVVNVAGPWSRVLNEMAGVLSDFTTSTRPLEQQVISLPSPTAFDLAKGVCVTDADFGTYFRPHFGQTLLVGGMEPPCDPLIWLDRPEQARSHVTQETGEVQSLRVARRVPSLRVPGRSTGVVGVYDVTDDWIPIYDRSCLDGYYVAIGTSGHGFKQAPFVGELMATLILRCERGHQHDLDPVVVPATWTGNEVNLGHFSRLREVKAQAAMG